MSTTYAPESAQVETNVFTTSLYAMALRASLFLIVFAANIDVARIERLNVDVSVTPQVILKLILLGGLGILGVWGWWRNAKVRQYLLSVPGILLVGLGIWQFIGVPLAYNAMTSLAGSLAYAAALLGVVSGIVHLGVRRVLFDMVAAAGLYVVLGLLLYVAMPERAIFIEVMSATNKVPRLAGLGHPNILGRNCCFVILFFIFASVDRLIDWRWCLIVVPVFLFVTFAALSRTPLIALILTVGLLAIPLLQHRHAIYAIGFAAVVGIGLILVLELAVGLNQVTDRLISSGTKTGDVSEVTTVTGRTEIWAMAITLIKQSPIVGHGSGSLAPMLESLSGNARNVGHAHNILLSPTAQLGLPGGFIILLLLIWNGITAFQARIYVFLGSVCFLLLNGLVESPLLGALPDGMTFFWLVLCFWPLALAEKRMAGENSARIATGSPARNQPAPANTEHGQHQPVW
jgi:O-antigen ligase